MDFRVYPLLATEMECTLWNWSDSSWCFCGKIISMYLFICGLCLSFSASRLEKAFLYPPRSFETCILREKDRLSKRAEKCSKDWAGHVLFKNVFHKRGLEGNKGEKPAAKNVKNGNPRNHGENNRNWRLSFVWRY